MILQNTVRTGVEIDVWETIGYVPFPGGLDPDVFRVQLKNAGLTVVSTKDGVFVENPDVWIYELRSVATNKRIGQFVVGRPESGLAQSVADELGFNEDSVFDLFFGGIRPGVEYWKWHLGEWPQESFYMRAAEYTTALSSTPALFSSNHTAFDLKGPTAVPNPTTTAYQISTDAVPVGDSFGVMSVDLAQARQVWWVKSSFLSNGLIPAGGDGHWIFSAFDTEGAGFGGGYLELELTPP